jgi:oxygen-independent coproporphyrinogen III oxidase
MRSDLLKKYNTQAPRYTSYPTVPYWDKTPPSEKAWIENVQIAFSKNNEISLYIHLPFCERLCTYCGCNKRITKNHQVEEPYVNSLLKEWQLYLDLLPSKPVIKEIHLGGGTPTFFQASQLKRLINGILKKAKVAKNHEFSFEVHPNSTTKEHLETLFELGFRRISIGVQDFADHILEIINRQQTTEDVERVTKVARAIGYTSINYDIIFGLPLQTQQNIVDNIEKIKELRPDRIAFYSYAHVPWIKPSQRAYSEADLPVDEEKRALYELGRNLLEETGYVEIGMDHFALPSDNLYKAMENKSLHRNFMGYTPFRTELMIGLGASSISDSWGAFIQNEKKIEDYQEIVDKGKIPIIRGHLLNDEDLIIRKHILNIMCHFETSWSSFDLYDPVLDDGLKRLKALENDGLLKLYPFHLKVSEEGRPFIRNICMALDAKLWREKPKSQLFSQAV